LLNHLVRQEFPMAEISPLRRRMIDDMMIRNLSPAAQHPTSMRSPSSAGILVSRRTGWGWRKYGLTSST
jgi:hypothetical protein